MRNGESGIESSTEIVRNRNPLQIDFGAIIL